METVDPPRLRLEGGGWNCEGKRYWREAQNPRELAGTMVTAGIRDHLATHSWSPNDNSSEQREHFDLQVLNLLWGRCCRGRVLGNIKIREPYATMVGIALCAIVANHLIRLMRQ
jgi:hypothetical protein